MFDASTATRMNESMTALVCYANFYKHKSANSAGCYVAKKDVSSTLSRVLCEAIDDQRLLHLELLQIDDAIVVLVAVSEVAQSFRHRHFDAQLWQDRFEFIE
jgi:hypothetical protein